MNLHDIATPFLGPRMASVVQCIFVVAIPWHGRHVKDEAGALGPQSSSIVDGDLPEHKPSSYGGTPMEASMWMFPRFRWMFNGFLGVFLRDLSMWDLFVLDRSADFWKEHDFYKNKDWDLRQGFNQQTWPCLCKYIYILIYLFTFIYMYTYKERKALL